MEVRLCPGPLLVRYQIVGASNCKQSARLKTISSCIAILDMLSKELTVLNLLSMRAKCINEQSER